MNCHDVNCHDMNPRCVVYSACLSERGFLAKSERSMLRACDIIAHTFLNDQMQIMLY